MVSMHGPGYKHSTSHTPQHWFPQHEYGSSCHGYILPPTIEEELEILETWKAMMDKKLARIANIIGKLQKEA